MGVFARSLLAGVLFGSACMGLLAVVAVLVGGTDGNGLGYVVFAILLFAGVFGGIPGAVVGTIVGLVRRAASRPKPVPAVFVGVDMWSAMVDRCAESTRRVAAAVATVPPSAARDWMVRISAELSRELDDVRGIAQLGRALGAVDPQHPVYQRLDQAVHDFAVFEREVGRVALTLFDHPELDQVQLELELLEKQVPHLSG